MGENERLIVAIAGPTCSRKTTLLDALKQRMGPEIATVHFDDFDLYPPGSPSTERAIAKGNITNWEDPSLFDIPRYLATLRNLKSGHPAKIYNRSRENVTSDNTYKIIEPAPVVLVEGIFPYASRYAIALTDVRIFMNINPEDMVRARLARTPADSPYPWDQIDYITGPMVIGTKENVMPQMKKAHYVYPYESSIDELVEKTVRIINSYRTPGVRVS